MSIYALTKVGLADEVRDGLREGFDIGVGSIVALAGEREVLLFGSVYEYISILCTWYSEIRMQHTGSHKFSSATPPQIFGHELRSAVHQAADDHEYQYVKYIEVSTGQTYSECPARPC